MQAAGARREREVGAVTAALAAGRGALLTGDAGVGKTFIADRIAHWADADGWYVVRARATAGSAELPLAAFAGQLGDHERFLTPVLTEIRDRIVEQADGRRVVLVVDDVNLLDDASSALVHQLVSSVGVGLVATLRQGEPIPGEFDELLRRGVLDRVAVPPFDVSEIAAVAALTESRPLAPDTLALLHRWSRGNPLFVRELLLSAQEDGRLVDGDEGLVLSEVPVAAPRLLDVMRSRLGHLSEHDRTLLLHVAFAEPCGPGELAGVADVAALARLERAGVLHAEPDGNRLVVRLAHPLYGAVMRAAAGPLERRAVLGTLAEALRATGARRRADVIKLARLAVDGGVTVAPDLLVKAATEAFLAGDFGLCERIGRRAFEQAGTWESGWHLGRALTFLTDADAAREQVEALRRVAVTPAEIVATEMLDAEVAFWVEGDADAAEACRSRSEHLLDVEDFGVGPVPPEDFRLSFSVLLASQARLAEAHELIDTYGTDELGVAFIRGTHARSHCYVQEARPLDAIAEAEKAVAAFAAAGPWGTPVSRRSVITHISTGRTWGGDPRTGLAEAIEARDTATDDFQLAIAALAQAMASAMLGRPRTAGSILEGAASRWRAVAGGGLPVRWLLGISTWAHSAAGEIALAKQRLAEFDARPHPAISLDAYAEVGRARILVAEGHLDAGRNHLRATADRYQAEGRLSSELMVRYELVRLGHADDMAARMAAVRDVAQGGMFLAWIDHAVASAAGAVDDLAAVSDRLADMGYLEFAADAAAHASDAARRAGDQRAANRLSLRVADLRGRCETPGSPLVAAIETGPVPLTRRERDVAMLAAQGLASKEIGERLFISFRTAENHLARVYDKLGIRTRAELARALDGGTPALVA